MLFGEVFVARDHLHHFLAKRWILAQALEGRGSLIWNPFEAAGTIFLADPQSGVLYPPALLLFGLLPFAFAAVFYLALHLVILGLGSYGWLRAMGFRQAPSALGACAWQWSGFTLSLCDLQNNLTTLAWVPVALLCAERSLRGGLRWPALAALSLAAAFHAGEPQVAAAAALLVAGRMLLARRARRSLPQACGRLALTASLAALLSLAQALPLLEHVRETRRAEGMPRQLVEQGSLRAIELLDLFAPALFEAPGAGGMKLSGTQPWLATLYLGWVPIALAVWMGRRALRRVAPWAALGLAGLLLAMGPFVPGGEWLHSQGLLSWLRYPVRFFFLALPAVALAVALGSNRLEARLRAQQLPPRRAFAPSFAALALGLLVAGFSPAALGSFAGELGMEMLRGVALAGLVAAWAVTCLPHERRRRHAMPAFVLLMALDLLAYEHSGFAATKFEKVQAYLEAVGLPQPEGGQPPPRVMTLSAPGEGKSFQAYADSSAGGLADLLPSGTLGLAGVADLSRDGVYPLRDYEPVLGALVSGGRMDAFLGVEARERRTRLERLEGDRSPLRLVQAREGGEQLEVVLEALRRPASLATDGVPVPTDAARRAPGRCVELASVELLDWSAHDLRARVESPCAITLVHLQSLAPGWRAEIDEEPAPLAPALGAYQSLAVPAGTRIVRFVHEPPGFAAAAPVSFTALLLTLLLTLRRRKA